MNDVDILQKIKETRDPLYRPPFPQQESEGVHPGILVLMKQCWAEEPNERPSFNDIIKSLKTINKGKSVYFYCSKSCYSFGCGKFLHSHLQACYKWQIIANSALCFFTARRQKTMNGNLVGSPRRKWMKIYHMIFANRRKRYCQTARKFPIWGPRCQKAWKYTTSFMFKIWYDD